MIQAGGRQLGIELSGTQIRSLIRFLGVLRAWNARFRMVGTDDIQAQINRHIVDSLAPATFLQGLSSLVDVGTGAGLPGIPLSISCPQLSVTLVDSRRTRANFVREVIRQLNLSNARVSETRIEALAIDPAATGSFDATIARAWAQLPRFLEVSAGLLRPGGIAVSMKGPKFSHEIAKLHNLRSQFRQVGRKDYFLPDTAGQRTLLIFVRT